MSRNKTILGQRAARIIHELVIDDVLECLTGPCLVVVPAGKETAPIDLIAAITDAKLAEQDDRLI